MGFKMRIGKPVSAVLASILIVSLVGFSAQAAIPAEPPIEMPQSQDDQFVRDLAEEVIQYVPGYKLPLERKTPLLEIESPIYEYSTTTLPGTSLQVADVAVEPIPQGDREWVGEQSPELVELSIRLMDLLDTYGDNLAGVAFSSNDQYLEVYVTDVDGAGIDEVNQLAEEAGLADRVVIISVQRSLDELWSAADAVDDGSDGILTASPDFISNGLRIAPTEPLEVAPDPTVRSLSSVDEIPESIVSDLTSLVGDLPVTIEPYLPVEDADRYNDWSPFYGGAEIISSSGSYCSLGVPLVIQGRFTSLTAGHCGSGPFKTAKKQGLGVSTLPHIQEMLGNMVTGN